jgi:hypothetical protein
MALTRIGLNQSINLASNVTGTLPAANGGSGRTVVTGNVLQVVQANKQDMASSSSTSYVDISGLSVNITPSSSSNKILVFFSANTSTQNHDAQGKLLRDSTEIIGTGATNNATMFLRTSSGDVITPTNSMYLDSPNTTSQVTYKLQWKAVSNTVYLNRRMGDTTFGTISNITAMEISA